MDVGRNSAADLAELAVGATNYDLIFGPRGQNAAVELEKSAKFVKLIKDLAKKYQVEPGEITANVADAAMKLAQAEAAKAQSEQKEQYVTED